MASSDISFEQLPLQAKLRIDAVCARFEAAWAIEKPRLESFSAEVPEAEQAVLLAELLFPEMNAASALVGSGLAAFRGVTAAMFYAFAGSP